MRRRLSHPSDLRVTGERRDGRPGTAESAGRLLAASADGAGHATEVDVPAAYEGLLRAGHGPMVGEGNDDVNVLY